MHIVQVCGMAWLYQQKGSANWWIGYRQGGRQYLRSTGTANKARAEQELAKVQTMFLAQRAGNLTDELYSVLTGKALPRVPLMTALDDWLAEVKATTAPRTLEKYLAVAREFQTHLNATETLPLVAEVQTEAVRGFLNKRRECASTGTVNLDRKILAVFFSRALKNGLIKANPILPLKHLKSSPDENQARRSFTLAEVQLLYAKASDAFWRYMILGGFYSGQRMGDLICLRWGSVDFTQNLIRLTTAKTGTRLQIPLARPLRQCLLNRQAIEGSLTPSDFVWPEQAGTYQAHHAGPFSNAFHEIMASAGLVTPRETKHGTKQGRKAQRALSSVSFHCFRHTFVSLLKIMGGNAAVAKELAGHSSDLVSDAYTHLPAEVLSKAINQLPELTT